MRTKLLCKIALPLLSVIGFFPKLADAAVDPSSAIVRMYKAYVSPNGDCSDPILMFDAGTAGVDFNMLEKPVMGEPQIPARTYQCMIWELSDKVRYTPKTTEGVCIADREVTRYVCQAGIQTKNPITGLNTTCTGTSSTGEDTMWVYISTWSASTGGASTVNPMLPPVAVGDKSKGMNLSSPIEADVPGGEFILNLSGKIVASNGECDMQPPTFGFRATTVATATP